MVQESIDAQMLLQAYAGNNKLKHLTRDPNGSIWGYTGEPKLDPISGTWYGPDATLMGKLFVTEFIGKPTESCCYPMIKKGQEWIGYHCWFSDNENKVKAGRGAMRKLGSITDDGLYIDAEYNIPWKYCRPVRQDEMKFYNDNNK